MSRHVTNVLSRLRVRRRGVLATASSHGRPARGRAPLAHTVEPLEQRALLAAVTFPSAPGVELQTSGPLQPATVGDWYTASGTASTDRAHYFVVEVTAAMLAAGSGTVNITVNDAESGDGPGVADEVANEPDPTRFRLLASDRATVLSSVTVPSGSADGSTAGFGVTAAGTYYIQSVTGALPISGDATPGLNDDDNAFSITVSQEGGLVGQYQATFQQTAPGSRDMYFLVGPGTTSLYLRNFDADGSATVSYTLPNGAIQGGTASTDGFWNGPAPTPNTGGDTLTGLTPAAAGLWKVTFGGWDAGNQVIFEPNTGTELAPGSRLVVFDTAPTTAGNFALTGGGSIDTPVTNAASHTFTVTNNYATTDTIELSTANTAAHFTAQLFTAGGVALTDTTGDGLVDTGVLAPGESRNFVLRVTPNNVTASTDTTRVNAVSLMDRGVNASNTTRSLDFTTRRANAAPVNAVPGAQSAVEDGPARVFSSSSGNAISVADADLDGGVLTLTLTATGGVVTLARTTGLGFNAGDGTSDATMTFGGTLSNVTFALDGMSFRPSPNFNGAATLRVFTSDNGNTGVGGTKSDDDTVTINVTPANDPPANSLPAAQQSTAEDTPLTFSSAGGNGLSVADPDGSSLPVRVTLAATNGTVSLSGTSNLTFQAGDGTADATVTFTGPVTDVNAALNGLTFIPAQNFEGSAGLTLTTDDEANGGAGGAMTDSDSVSIAVSAANDPPVNNLPVAAQATAEDTPLTLSTAGGNVLSVSDPDGSAPVVRVTLTATNGTLTLSGTSGLSFLAGDGTSDATMTFTGAVQDLNAAMNGLAFTPPADFNGAAGITMTSDDLGNGGAGGAMTDADTLEITVTPVNDPPVAGDDAFTVNEDVGPTALDVLANDADGDGQPLAITVNSATGGTAAVDDRGTPSIFSDDRITFTPERNFHGDAVITYTVSDGDGGTDTAVAAVTVSPVPEAPTAANDAAVVAQDSAVTTDPLANDSDPDGDIRPELTAILTGPAHGTATVDPTTGRITYTPAAGYSGPDALTYAVTDAASLSATATVSFTVSPTNVLAGAASDFNATAGALFSGTVGSFVYGTGPAKPTAYRASVNWGDGFTSEGTVVANASGGFDVTASHVYAAVGNYAFTLTVTSRNGRTAVVTATAHVTAEPVTGARPSVQWALVEKQASVSRTRRVAGRSVGADVSRTWSVAGELAGPADGDTTLTVDWGDQLTTQVTVSGGQTAFGQVHEFAGRKRRGPVLVTVLGGAGGPFRARSANELWIMDRYRHHLGQEAPERRLAELAGKLDRALNSDVARQRIEQQLIRLADRRRLAAVARFARL